MPIEVSGPWNVTTALRQGRDALESCSETPDLDSQLLLGFVLGMSRLQLIVEAKTEVPLAAVNKFFELVERRKKLEPVAYITGSKEFWGMDFKVNRHVLIPRPDTELLVDMAVTYSAEFSDPILVCDLGTGSGCIAVAMAFELQRRDRNFYLLAADRSLEALKVAKQNAIENKLDKKIDFVCSDWSNSFNHEFDLVLANPPYLSVSEFESSEALKFEPESALHSGVEGLNDFNKIFKLLPKLLSRKGVFLGEIGFGQAHLIEDLAKEILPAPQIHFHYDLHRVQRVVEIRLHNY